MEGPKKFNAFSGVFTPSILTILGVIMYLRLGWVVGQAGLWMALGIIFVAHIISVTTSLSISSMATDKKIKTGGIYYILSRSLGLPMGGAIGLILFVGTAFGISLYIVGFVENFLAIEAINNFLGLDPGVNSIRIVGSIALVVLVIIAFISTSLAIKTQYFVLTAIALSLISVIFGFFYDFENTSREWILHPVGDFNPMLVFAVFFPAVTGFTAGVAMSGDLKDPKKDIPKGTIWAVSVGFIVYVTLAISLSYFVDKDLLLNDSSALMNIAIYSPLVIAGIWGATLSSALGGILGGPRIMQAIAMDKLLPKFVAKGSGKSNEPRNALILTFIIAELGILIGELNAIAALVSVFYISAYGFINLSFALEKWASTDFRPSFNVSLWFGVIGFIASILVMFQLNPLAMLGAFIILAILYFILKRQKLRLEIGDVWYSVRSTIARYILTGLNKRTLEQRNWQPNIILFSGLTDHRRHLLKLGKEIVGSFGFLSNFEMVIKNKSDEVIYTKEQQSEDNESNKQKGFFNRKHSVNNIYEGMEQISSIYGFSGIEPNTVMMGWGSNTEDPERYTKTLKYINRLKLNLLIFKYNKEKNFGNHSTIDIYMRGGGPNAFLSLHLVKILKLSKNWANSKIRIITVNPINKQHSIIHKYTEEILQNLRVEAKVKVINNELEKKPLKEIVQIESEDANLIFIGLPDFNSDKFNFFEKLNSYTEIPSNIFFVKATESFVTEELQNKRITIPQNYKSQSVLKETVSKNINYPKNHEAKNAVKQVYSYFNSKLEDLKNNELNKLFEEKKEVFNSLKKEIQKSFLNLNYVSQNYSKQGISNKINIIHSNFLSNARATFNKLRQERNEEYAKIISDLTEQKIENILNIVDNVPKYIHIQYSKDELKINKKDSLELKSYKFRASIISSLFNRKVNYKLRNKEIIKQYLIPYSFKKLEYFINNVGVASHTFTVESKNIIDNVDEIFKKIQNEIIKEDNYQDIIANYKSELLQTIEKAEFLYNKMIVDLNDSLSQNYIDIANELSRLLSKVAPNLLLNEDFSFNRNLKKQKAKFNNISENWLNNQNLVTNQLLLDIALLNLQSQIIQIVKETKINLNSQIASATKNNQNIVISYLNNYLNELKSDPQKEFDFNIEKLDHDYQRNFGNDIIPNVLKKIKRTLSEFPKTIEIMSDEEFNLLTNKPFIEVDSIKISVIQLIDYLINKEFIEFLKTRVDKTKKDISAVNDKLHKHIRLIKYELQEDEEITQSEVNTDEPAEIIEKQISEIKEELIQTDELIIYLNKSIDKQLVNIIDKLSTYPFISAAQNLKQYIKSRSSSGKTIIRQKLNKIYKGINESLANVLYTESKGFLFTRKLFNLNFKENKEFSSLLELKNKFTASDETIKKLPFYYLQLFLSKHNYLNDFWFGRERELKVAEKLIQNYYYGYKGAISVYGERHSGKSFFAQYISNKYLLSYNTIYVNAPAEGSTSIEKFDAIFKEQLKDEGSYDKIFNNLNAKTVIIFEDIELWWEKTNTGIEVINHIKNIIERYSERFLFIVTINDLSFKFLNKLINFNESFLGNIKLDSVDAETLKDIVITRHESALIKFVIGSKDEDRYKAWDYANLFNKYFKLTKGNIGFTLNLWVNNITDVKGETIYMRKPVKVFTTCLDKLSSKEKLAVEMFILHSSLTVSKLSRVAKISISEAQRIFKSLKNSGVIYESTSRVYKTDRMLHHFFIDEINRENYI